MSSTFLGHHGEVIALILAKLLDAWPNRLQRISRTATTGHFGAAEGDSSTQAQLFFEMRDCVGRRLSLPMTLYRRGLSRLKKPGRCSSFDGHGIRLTSAARHGRTTERSITQQSTFLRNCIVMVVKECWSSG